MCGLQCRVQGSSKRGGKVPPRDSQCLQFEAWVSDSNLSLSLPSWCPALTRVGGKGGS
jgi:hypothetical protein